MTRFAVLAFLTGCFEVGTPSPHSDGGVPTPDSVAAVRQTAQHNAACQDIKPFYWEIGDGAGMFAGNAEGDRFGPTTRMSIASASKWIYGAYYLQRIGGQLSADDDIALLNFTSGHTRLVGTCLGLTVHGCNVSTGNDKPDANSVGRFHYDSGHLEYHAEHFGMLGNERAETLGDELSRGLGNDLALSYENPLLAGGASTSAAEYAAFLRKILRGELLMRDQLGSHQVCTLSADYASALGESCDAAQSPWWPATSGKLSDTPDRSAIQNVHYSLAHWVEQDGAFSSPGLFGFYPWIDANKQYYGIVARQRLLAARDLLEPTESAYAQSVRCGQALRAAWLSGHE